MINWGLPMSKCTGCEACVNICNNNAIQMEKMKDGFRYPRIDVKKCTECKQCLKVCNSKSNIRKQKDFLDSPLVYAMRNKNTEIRLHSTSGGIFSELAECILNKKGNVAGAVYMPDWSAEHHMIQDLKDLEDLRRSKYQQSNINLLFRKVKTVLDEQKTVLFCGTPCQIGGLKAFLGKEYDGLFTCDFICRGVSSPKIFASYIENLKHTYGSEIKYIWMKNKCNGWHSLTTVVGFENGETYVRGGLEDSYVQLYLKYNIGVRKSCYECEFKGERDAADITLGDFWGLEDPVMDDNKGTSVVICRTERGKQLVDKIKEHVFYQRKEIEEVEKGNPCLYHSIKKCEEDQEKFYEILEREGYQKAVEAIVKK